VSTFPADGAVSVPEVTTFSTTFSLPLDTVYNHSSRGAVLTMIVSGGIQDFGDYSYSPDLRTYMLNLTLAPNRDFFFVVADARATNGDTLWQFAPLRFSTASARGERSISGQVNSQNGSLHNTIVFLTEQYPVIEPNMFDGSLGCLYDTVAAGYRVSDVRAGHTYWICAIQIVSFSANHAAIGFYDPDQNGHADSVVVGESDLADLNITMPVDAVEPHVQGAPMELTLEQNYPNPFNPSTTLRFNIPRVANVTLDVFDVMGRKTQTLFSGVMQPGEHAIAWNCPDCASGMYFAQLTVEQQTVRRMMLLVK
jgi:hypothetical protein